MSLVKSSINIDPNLTLLHFLMLDMAVVNARVAIEHVLGEARLAFYKTTMAVYFN